MLILHSDTSNHIVPIDVIVMVMPCGHAAVHAGQIVRADFNYTDLTPPAQLKLENNEGACCCEKRGEMC